jgi:hypothetical protein
MYKGSFILILCLLQSFTLVRAEKIDINHKLSGTVQLHYVSTDETLSFLHSGVGIVRYDDKHSDWQLGQMNLNYQLEVGSDFSAHIDAHYYDDLNHRPDITQANIRYAPLPIKGYRLRMRLGMMYPSMSLENTRTGWLSNSSYTNSAINTWIGEEVRSNGLEFSLTRPGRRFRSPWTYTIIGAAFKGNDPAGSMLAWRGWGLHDRQTGLNERLPLANYPGLDGPILSKQTRQLNLFEEIDGRWGTYFGAHVKYLSRFESRFYHYDSNAEPTAFNNGQWAWDTTFDHMAARYSLSSRWVLQGQYLKGQSVTGRNFVSIEFDALYVSLRYRQGDHRATLRFDDFSSDDKDEDQLDDNNSEGNAWTFYYQYQYSKHLSAGIELLKVDTTRANLESLIGVQQLEQNQLIFGLNYSW